MLNERDWAVGKRHSDEHRTAPDIAWHTNSAHPKEQCEQAHELGPPLGPGFSLRNYLS
jgi:hypothetical protein